MLTLHPEERTLQKSPACPDNASTLNGNQCPGSNLVLHHSIPRLGMGSSSCAGNENLTFAMSETPMNLQKTLRQPLFILMFVRLSHSFAG